MKVIISRIILALLMTSCLTSKSQDSYVRDFYEKLKKHESQLSILKNVTFDSRGKRNNMIFIPAISIALNEKENITLPAIYPGMADDKIKSSLYFDNMKVYAEKVGIPDSLAFQVVKEYSKDIIKLAIKLDLHKIQSTPRLGEFIIFQVTEHEQLIYITDLSKVNYPYWKKFFASREEFADNWYYLNTKSN